MKKLVCLVLVIMLALVQSIALAQISSTENAVPINSENYPYFYVMGISQPQAEASSSILLKGCFGDFQSNDSDGEADLNVFGFDEENPIELKLADDCLIFTPMDFDENIATNHPVKTFCYGTPIKMKVKRIRLPSMLF